MTPRARALVASPLLLVLALGCRHTPPAAAPTAVTRPLPRCPSSATIPSGPSVRRVLRLRPAAIFAHPRLGRLLAECFDDAGDSALFERARRVGYDLRTLDRAVLAWTPHGMLAVGHGNLDSARIAERLWERLLPPLRRVDRERGSVRLDGVLGRVPVSVAVVGRCGIAAYAERAPEAVDALVDPAVSPSPPDDDPMLVWTSNGVPDELATEVAAENRPLASAVRSFELRSDAVSEGVALGLVLDGPLPDDADARLRRAVRAFAASPLGGSIGADAWADERRLEVRREGGRLRASITVPWAAVQALAEVLRGRVVNSATERPLL